MVDETRKLVVVLGDQLDHRSAAFDHGQPFDPAQDAVWMAEVTEESTHVWTHKARIALFLSAMRHFRDRLRADGITVHYRELPRGPAGPDHLPPQTLTAALTEDLQRLNPAQVVMVMAGEHRLTEGLGAAVAATGRTLELAPDNHFYATPEQFADHAEGRKQLRLEFFYRELRKRHDILMADGKPEGGAWNYDTDNRGSFSKTGPTAGPGMIPPPASFPPDEVTADVLALVSERFADHPGSLDRFDWPVTAEQAETALDDFIANRLPDFGRFQDAMWGGEAYLYHSRLSAAMNLKLLDPRLAVDAAVEAYHRGHAPLNSVEGFVRQILGWREYVRGIYWLHMPGYVDHNHLDAHQPLPDFYWTGETDMACLSDVIGQTLEYGYAHHIQRLMVTGLYSLLLGVDPNAVHRWYLAVYVDAVEWVELPNTLGMSQFADGGIMASKPYAATGKYLKRMSNHCRDCRFNPDKAVGDDACPYTTLYWDFLRRHRERLRPNNRMAMQLRNVDRKDPDELAAIAERAEAIRANDGRPPPS
jgi:deoxyribodipyrimidine photolyase-related protein